VIAYQHLDDHQALLEILPDAKKAKSFSDKDYHELLSSAWEARIEAAESSVQQVFAQLPKELNAEPRLLLRYARALQAQGADQSALDLIRKTLKRQWSSDLVRVFGELHGDDPAKALRTAESWLKDHPDDPELLLTLGRLALANEHWPQAREYLEASLRAREDYDVYAELGRLCIASGDAARGSEYLLRSRPELPELPMPDAQLPSDEAAST
jgi:HemY protein